MSGSIFVTGTDTGAGKTILTALLVAHLRQSGRRAWAMKPFCSGGLADVRLLQKASGGNLSLAEICPNQFRQPLAPLIAARNEGRTVGLTAVLAQIRELAARCDWLVVEGAGGLLAPLGEGFTAAEIIQALPCRVIVAAANRLGVINHALLTAEALRKRGIEEIILVLMGTSSPKAGTRKNGEILEEMGHFAGVFEVPHLGKGAGKWTQMEGNVKKLKKTLATISENAMFSPASKTETQDGESK